MKRVGILICVLSGFTGAGLFAQTDSNHSLRINGFGGFGFGYTNIQSGSLLNSTYEDFSKELGLDASGFIYDRRLVNYNFSAFWDGNNTSIDQGSARSNGLSFNGGLDFLSERSFPFAIYFSQSHSNNLGSLIPAFSTTNTLYGLRGQIKKPKLALISYNVGTGKTENDLPNGDIFNTRTRFASVTATRKLLGWDLRFGDDYLRTASTFSNFLDRENTVSFDASRSFGERVHVGLGASHSSFGFKDLTSKNSTDSGVTILNGNLTWKHTEKLDSFYNFTVTRNAVNTLLLVSQANGLPNVSLPFNPATINSTAASLAAGANYQATSRLTLNANLTYSHNGLPSQTLDTIPTSVRNALTTGVLGTGVGYNYRRKVWKLEYNSTSSVDWQHFSLLAGRADSGVGYTFDNGVTGGDVRKVRFGASFRYSTRSNPFFFNVVTTSDRRATLKLESQYLRFMTLEGIADIGTTTLDLAGSRIHLDTSNYMASASLPRQRLTFFASRGVSSSAERFFGPDSIFFQPGGTTGGIPVPGALFNPLIYSDVLSQRLGLIWRPRRNLDIESRLSNNRYLFTFQNAVENRYKQFDTMVNYKFGRFTISLGYGTATGDAFLFHQDVNRFFLRLRFPFHVL